MCRAWRRVWPAATATPLPRRLCPGYGRATSRSCRDVRAAFHRFCQFNPKPCPIIGISEVGDPRIPALGDDLDIRTDLPRYRVWRDGAVVEEPTDIKALWRVDLVAFVIGCSFSFEEALLADDIPIRHIERGVRVPMYRTNIACQPAGPFAGPMVVSMRPLKPADAIRAVQITSRFPSVPARGPSTACRDRSGSRHRKAGLRRSGAGSRRRDPGVLGLRGDASGGDRRGEGAVRDHSRAGLDACHRPQEPAACRALMLCLNFNRHNQRQAETINR